MEYSNLAKRAGLPPFDGSRISLKKRMFPAGSSPGALVLLGRQRFIADCRMANQYPAPHQRVRPPSEICDPVKSTSMTGSLRDGPPKPAAVARSAGSATPCDPRAKAAGPPPREEIQPQKGERENPGCWGSSDPGEMSYRATVGRFFGRPGPEFCKAYRRTLSAVARPSLLPGVKAPRE